MCFSVALTRETIENDPRFAHLLDEMYQTPGSRISGFSFPGLPILTEQLDNNARLAYWGLIPNWVRDDAQAKRIRSGTLNARWETVRKKPSFRDCWPLKRCIIPVDGFYEPHVEGKIKSSWFVSRKDSRLLFLGGIYQDHYPAGSGFQSATFSILTLTASDLLALVHNEKLRMPLILSEDRAGDWLDKGIVPDCEDRTWLLDQTLLRASESSVADKSSHWSQGTLF